MLVVLGDQISNAHQEAQRALGNFAPDPVSVGDLFAGALIPGLVLVGLYILYQMVIALLRPASSPAMPRERGGGAADRSRRVGHALVAPIVLIIAVLGSILAGVATPTEAAGVGAIGATLLAGQRLVPEPAAADLRRRARRWSALLLLTSLHRPADRRAATSRSADQAGIGLAAVLCLRPRLGPRCRAAARLGATARSSRSCARPRGSARWCS